MSRRIEGQWWVWRPVPSRKLGGVVFPSGKPMFVENPSLLKKLPLLDDEFHQVEDPNKPAAPQRHTPDPSKLEGVEEGEPVKRRGRPRKVVRQPEAVAEG